MHFQPVGKVVVRAAGCHQVNLAANTFMVLLQKITAFVTSRFVWLGNMLAV